MNTQEKESNAIHGTAKEATSSAYSEKPNEQLIERHEIKDTPFTAVKAGDKWMLTMGKYRLVDNLASLEDCEIASFDTTWNRILQVVGIMIENWQAYNGELEQLQRDNEQLKKALSNIK